jgi:hypothetical protein
LNGYVVVGYIICIGSLSAYAITLYVREQRSRRRRPPGPGDGEPPGDMARTVDAATPPDR